jgi:hypothetical protein
MMLHPITYRTALYASLLLIGSIWYAVGQVPASPGSQTDPEMEGFLLKVEQQIVAGHISSPANDNAMDTWRRVIERAYTGTSESLNAVAHFAARERKRAADESSAGRSNVSDDLNVFVELAGLLTNAVITPTGPSSQVVAPATEQSDSLPVATSATDSARSSAASGSVPVQPAKLEPESPASEPSSVVLVVRPADPPTIAPSLRQEPLAVVYADRGDQMLASKDISAARKLYEYAANAGSARAAIALARTYDPSFLRQLGAIGVKPDPGLATTWYRKAAALGDRDAAFLADKLANSNAR